MRLSRLRIVNHHRIADLDIEVRQHLVLVGANDIGKTTILRCLDALLRAPKSQLYAWFGVDHFRDPAQPLVLEATLVGLDSDELAWFADDVEILSAGSGYEYRLTIRLTISLDAMDPESKSVAREFIKPDGVRPVGHQQLAGIGWSYLPASRSADHELGGGRAGAARALLAEVDLGEAAAVLQAALGGYQAGLDGAKALGELCGDVATGLSAVYPRPVGTEDVSVQLRQASGDALLGEVDLHVDTARGRVRLPEQSDGIRALTTIALHRLARRSARIVAVDEPELHLHPRSQARVGALLAAGPGQAAIATHAPPLLAAFSPSDVVAFGPDGTTRQVDPTRFDADWRFRQHFWLDSALEPLTARALAVVEGVSDRIMLHAVARALGLDLDQAGVCAVVVHGASNFPSAYPAVRSDRLRHHDVRAGRRERGPDPHQSSELSRNRPQPARGVDLQDRPGGRVRTRARCGTSHRGVDRVRHV